MGKNNFFKELFINIISLTLALALTCTGCTGLVTGVAFVFLCVKVEPVHTAPLAPVPLQTGAGGESMWDSDTLSQSYDTITTSHCLQTTGSLLQPTTTTAPSPW